MRNIMQGCISLLALLLPLVASQSRADCTATITAGDDATVCDSGSSGALTDRSGNNSLTFPAQGTAVILGNVTFGPGNDQLNLGSGRIVGLVSMGDGANTVTIDAGTISGAVTQGSGIDRFIMNGGSIASLAQGDGRDSFLMTGGSITGAFEDGDVAQMTGGSIGRVDMKLDNNNFNMSGGRIIGNLVSGFGNDTINLSGGSIGGNISVSGGVDRISVSGGEVGGQILASTGNDIFQWSNAGILHGAVLLAAGDDNTTLNNLDENTLGATPQVDGGPGVDVLTFNGVNTSVPGRYSNWETVNLNNGSHMDLGGTFTLGDSGTGTGVLNIDASSRLSSISGVVSPFTSGQNVTLNNAGTLDMTTGSNSATDTLQINGNYVGNSGQLLLQTVLGDDSSPSDKLVVSQGSISGTTQMTVSNLGGVGAATELNGIQVVQALNGASSTDNAFTLHNSLSAGAYQYYLFKGGATAGSENSWFLRSAVISPPASALFAAPVEPVTPVTPTAPSAPTTPAAPTAPSAPATPVTPTTPSAPATPVTPTTPGAPAPPVTPTAPSAPATPVTPTAPNTPSTPTTPVAPATPGSPVTPATPTAVQPATTLPVPAPGSPALPAAVVGAAPVPLYRQEVPDYAVVPAAAALLTRTTLGTFHDRQGEQRLLSETGAVPAGWARVFGEDFRQSWSGTVAPSVDASLTGYQIGHDLYASTTAGGQIQRGGLFIGHSQLSGHVHGFEGGFKDQRSGKLKIDGDSAGAYLTLTDPKGWYLDGVAMGTRLNGYSRSERGLGIDTRGRVLSLSVEGGYPMAISSRWVIEPQAQWISQHVRLDSDNDGISRVSFSSRTWNTARVGARLKGDYRLQGMTLTPYLQGNIWHDFAGSDAVVFDHVDRISTEHRATSLELGAGLVATVSKGVSVYVGADYHGNLDGNDLRGVSANLGLRLSW